MNNLINKDIEFLRKIVPEVFNRRKNETLIVDRKAEFDLVTTLDKNIENDLVSLILEKYPNDNILSEETRYNEKIEKRTWTIDPIDGTLNMSHNIKIYGIQLSLICGGEVELAYMYFPNFGDEYYAAKNEGCFLNGRKIDVDKKVTLEDSMVSFGDYTHKDLEMAKRQHTAIGILYPKIAKIRMFGTAALDFASVASGSTASCVVITKNLWDILPGLLIAKEAGAIISNLNGDDYKIGDDGIIASANNEIKKLVVDSIKK